MAECTLAWVCIIAAVVTKDPLWAVASALFALTLHVGGDDNV